MKLDEASKDGDWHRCVTLPMDSEGESWRLIEPSEPKGWRDAWKVLRGRYTPSVRVLTRLTSKGYNVRLKKHYVEPMSKTLNQPTSFLQDSSQD